MKRKLEMGERINNSSAPTITVCIRFILNERIFSIVWAFSLITNEITCSCLFLVGPKSKPESY